MAGSTGMRRGRDAEEEMEDDRPVGENEVDWADEDEEGVEVPEEAFDVDAVSALA